MLAAAGAGLLAGLTPADAQGFGFRRRRTTCPPRPDCPSGPPRYLPAGSPTDVLAFNVNDLPASRAAKIRFVRYYAGDLSGQLSQFTDRTRVFNEYGFPPFFRQYPNPGNFNYSQAGVSFSEMNVGPASYGAEASLRSNTSYAPYDSSKPFIGTPYDLIWWYDQPVRSGHTKFLLNPAQLGMGTDARGARCIARLVVTRYVGGDMRYPVGLVEAPVDSRFTIGESPYEPWDQGPFAVRPGDVVRVAGLMSVVSIDRPIEWGKWAYVRMHIYTSTAS
ncbi:hypothetical protein [Limnoglobus roseus]|uniref:Uncharacterized protein n=1 Tax=Limnoglobus roseus TaxID=2598579 RepID=A0A5C1AER2_9BACT|nr:hypothetical protein [Limnoglobus roseus]QEL15594.1 hypothetical protein PX52LOC_02526 [Limnoglobus roseus]